MTRLRVRIRNSMYDRRDRYDGSIPEYREYEGEVYPNPSWVTSDSFCLTTGDSQFPFRILCKEDIIHGWQLPELRSTLSSASEVASPETYQVTSKGKVYLVTRSKNKLSCNCTGFSYRRTCSHVKEVVDNDLRA